MKIATNFADPARQATTPLLLLGALASGLLLLLCAWMIRDASALRAELPELRQRVARGQASGQAVAPEQLQAARHELERARLSLARLNDVARAGGVSSAALLAELEALLPPEAWLNSLHYRVTEGEVRLVAAAPGAAPLSAFLLRLERSALFEQALLLREVPGAGGHGGVQFEIRLQVRP